MEVISPSALAALELVAADGALVFRISGSACVGGDWCQVYLRADGEGSEGGVERLLGAEVLLGLVRRMASALVQHPSELRWIFSLSERHSSLYGASRPEGWTVHLRDADAVVIAELVLSPEERARWLEQLAAFQVGRNGR